jgi:anti-sigma factor ChrR (cupin superfamily)
MSHENFEELCPLYVLNLLDEVEKERLESHLQTGCSLCGQILKQILETLSLLPYSLPSQAVPLQVKQKLMEQIQTEMKERAPRPTQHIIRPTQREWFPSPIPGVEIQPLWSAGGRSARLVKSQPGTVFPPHRHRGPELVYILKGSLLINGKSVKAGDFCISDPGFVDQDIQCEEECTFLLISNEDDELL